MFQRFCRLVTVKSITKGAGTQCMSILGHEYGPDVTVSVPSRQLQWEPRMMQEAATQMCFGDEVV